MAGSAARELAARSLAYWFLMKNQLSHYDKAVPCVGACKMQEYSEALRILLPLASVG